MYIEYEYELVCRRLGEGRGASPVEEPDGDGDGGAGGAGGGGTLQGKVGLEGRMEEMVEPELRGRRRAQTWGGGGRRSRMSRRSWGWGRRRKRMVVKWQEEDHSSMRSIGRGRCMAWA